VKIRIQSNQPWRLEYKAIDREDWNTKQWRRQTYES